MKTNDEIVKEIAEAFIRWKLPETVRSDLCATIPGEDRCGTNLMTIVEAEQMARDVVMPVITPLQAENAGLRGGVVHLETKCFVAGKEIDLIRSELADCKEALEIWLSWAPPNLFSYRKIEQALVRMRRQCTITHDKSP